MRIKTIGSGPFADLSISGVVAAIGGIEIDCLARQTDNQEVIDIKAGSNGMAEGTGDALVASVVIPPRQYDEEGEGEDAILVARPLDANEIIVKLWPYAN